MSRSSISKILLILAFVFLYAPRSEAAYALCAHTVGTAFGPSGGTTSAINTATSCAGSTAADLIVVGISECTVSACGGSAGSTPTDSQSNTYTKCGSAQVSGGESELTIWFVQAPSTNASHTVTYSFGTTYPTILVSAWKGSASSPCNQTNGATSTGTTSLSTGSITPSNNDLVVTASSVGNGETSGQAVAGYTTTDTADYASGSAEGGGMAYITSSGSATNPQWAWTGSSSAADAVASFKAAGGGGGSGGARLPLLGVGP